MAASVLLAKCGAQDQTYGIRIEKRENDWVSTWAFKIDDKKAKREGFDKTKITGTFNPDPDYPGCPYCGKNELLQCGCGKMFCYKQGSTSGKSETKGESRENRSAGIKCPWCGVAIQEIKTVESFTVKSGGF